MIVSGEDIGNAQWFGIVWIAWLFILFILGLFCVVVLRDIWKQQQQGYAHFCRRCNGSGCRRRLLIWYQEEILEEGILSWKILLEITIHCVLAVLMWILLCFALFLVYAFCMEEKQAIFHNDNKDDDHRHHHSYPIPGEKWGILVIERIFTLCVALGLSSAAFVGIICVFRLIRLPFQRRSEELEEERRRRGGGSRRGRFGHARDGSDSVLFNFFEHLMMRRQQQQQQSNIHLERSPVAEGVDWIDAVGAPLLIVTEPSLSSPNHNALDVEHGSDIDNDENDDDGDTLSHNSMDYHNMDNL